MLPLLRQVDQLVGAGDFRDQLFCEPSLIPLLQLGDSEALILRLPEEVECLFGVQRLRVSIEQSSLDIIPPTEAEEFVDYVEEGECFDVLDPSRDIHVGVSMS